MELLGDALQLVGFLVVTAAVLASLVAVAIGIAVFMYMTDRKIVVVKSLKNSHESNDPVEVRS